MIYGEPRLTLDVDIVLDLDSERCAELRRRGLEGAWRRVTEPE